jgi:hypothetical protein
MLTVCGDLLNLAEPSDSLSGVGPSSIQSARSPIVPPAAQRQRISLITGLSDFKPDSRFQSEGPAQED